MTLTVFLSVLCAAFLHASWNAVIKTGRNKQTAMMIMSVAQGIIGIAVVAFRPLPGAEVWPWLVASGLIHMAYQLFLAYAYEQGDLSRVYPIARGTAPLLVLLFSLAFLSETVSAMEYLGIAILGLGIVTMARGVFTSGESRRLVPYALGAACATAGYSIVDGLGARVEGDAIAYVGWLMMLSGAFYIPAVVALKGRAVTVASGRSWGMGFVAAVLSMGAYMIAVWAMTLAPIALVTALRETSILFAVLLGWLVFGDPMNRGKALAASLIVLGVVLTRL